MGSHNRAGHGPGPLLANEDAESKPPVSARLNPLPGRVIPGLHLSSAAEPLSILLRQLATHRLRIINQREQERKVRLVYPTSNGSIRSTGFDHDCTEKIRPRHVSDAIAESDTNHFRSLQGLRSTRDLDRAAGTNRRQVHSWPKALGSENIDNGIATRETMSKSFRTFRIRSECHVEKDMSYVTR